MSSFWAVIRSEIAVHVGNRTGVAAVGASELAKRLVPAWSEGTNLFYLPSEGSIFYLCR